MSFDVRAMIAQPGRRVPIRVTLTGQESPGNDLRSVEEITLDGEGFAQLGRLYLDVRLLARIVQPCRRCAVPVSSEIDLDESFNVPIPPGTEVVELFEPALRLALSAHDPNVLCREDCRGLCPGCGADLNQDPEHMCRRGDADRQRLRDLLS